MRRFLIHVLAAVVLSAPTGGPLATGATRGADSERRDATLEVQQGPAGAASIDGDRQPSSGSAGGVVTRSSPDDGSRFAFFLETPPFRLEPLDGGFHKISIDGFRGVARRTGAPDLPTHVYLVAIPPGAEPRLEHRVLGETFHPLKPAPVPSREPLVAEGDGESGAPEAIALRRPTALERYSPDPEIYERGTTYPERAVWLGEVGSLRYQRYVEVHVAPVRYDPAAGGVRVASGIEIAVHFDGFPGVLDAPRIEPRFEALYRGSFLNYTQGTRFRDGGAAPGAPGARGASSRQFLGTEPPRVWIPVDEDGLVRLDATALAGTGLLAHDPQLWRLTTGGVEVPLDVQDGGNGVLDPGERVEFFGRALLGEPKAVLNTDFPSGPDLYEARDFTDRNEYLLTVGVAPADGMTTREAGPAVPPRVPEPFFTSVAHAEVDDAFRPIGGADAWYWWPTLNANSPSNKTRTESVDLPGLLDPIAPVTVRAHLRGFTNITGGAVSGDQTHLYQVALANDLGQPLASANGSFEGRTLHLEEFGWTHAGGASMTGTVDLTLTLTVVPGVGVNQVILDWFEVEYRRAFLAQSDRLTFAWPDEDTEFVVGGFTNADIAVYEITDPDAPVRLTGVAISGGGPYSVRFRMDDAATGEERRFLAVAQDGRTVPGPGDVEIDVVSDLRDPGHQADLVVIAHPDVLDDGPGSVLEQLLAHRATAAGGGLTSKVVRLDDVEDEFADGLPGPDAIRAFLSWVLSPAGWAEPKPSYVLLLGDATYDYKSQTAAGTFVPTQIVYKDELELGYYASDNLLAAVLGGDFMPDVILGRVPARSVVQGETVLQKVLDYEQMTAPGTWRKHVLVISDRGSNSEGDLDFENTGNDALDAVGTQPYTRRHLRYYTDYYSNPGVPDPIEAIRGEIKEAVNGLDGFADGASVLQFSGHGNFLVWSNDAFFDEREPLPGDTRDVEDLFNATEQDEARLPFVMAHNCLTGGFHSCPAGDCASSAPNTMGEDWLNRDVGGAVGVMAPSGLSFNFMGNRVTSVVWPAMFGDRKERSVGNLMLSTLVDLCITGGLVEACQNYILLGDPALELALYAVDPPRDLEAIAGNGEVPLSWTASATPLVSYDVYRTENLAAQTPFYVKVNASPVTAPSFVDESAVNAKTYYYRVIATDPQGFKSRWSNFNSDCDLLGDLDGPDCVEVTPLNPNPPAVPTGLVVNDPGVGDTLELTWAPNPEDDILTYTVHVGTEPGVDPGDYEWIIETGNTTAYALRELDEGETYYIALSATNTSDNTSGLSGEVSDFPVLARGLRAPAFIDDLRVDVQDDDVRLDWTAVTTDIYGKPKDVATYEILRGVVADFGVEDLTLIGSCNAPCSSFLDPGAAISPTSHHYRVVAVDAEGSRGGLGSNLPQWTDLRVEKVPGDLGVLDLIWDPVVATFDDRPLQLKHYAVYVATEPFTRADIRDGLLVPAHVVTEPTLQIAMPPGNAHVSVLAVDIRDNASPF